MFPYPPWVSSSGPRQPGGTQRLDIQKHGHFHTLFGSSRCERQLQSLHLCIATLYSTIPSNSAISCCSPLRMVGVRDVFLQRKMAAATASHTASTIATSQCMRIMRITCAVSNPGYVVYYIYGLCAAWFN